MVEDRRRARDRSIGGTPFTGTGGRRVRFASGRVCRRTGARPSCRSTTTSEFCYLHERQVTPRHAGRARSPEVTVGGPTLRTLGVRDQPRVVGRGRTRCHVGRCQRSRCLAQPRPTRCRRRHLAKLEDDFSEGHDAGRSPRHRGHRPAPDLGLGPGPGRGPGGVGAQQHLLVPPPSRSRPRTARHDDHLPGPLAGVARRPPVPSWAWSSGGCPPGSWASTTCSAPKARTLGRRRVLRGPQHRGPRTSSRLSPRAIPAVDRPARGHPPVPVHRRAVVAAPFPLPGRPELGSVIARSPAACSRRSRRAAAGGAGRARNPLEDAGHARAGGPARTARGDRPDPGHDEPARRARRRDHGPGRGRRRPRRRLVLPGAARAPAPGPSAGRGCCSSWWGSRPRCASTSWGDGSSARWRATGGARRC